MNCGPKQTEDMRARKRTHRRTCRTAFHSKGHSEISNKTNSHSVFSCPFCRLFTLAFSLSANAFHIQCPPLQYVADGSARLFLQHKRYNLSVCLRRCRMTYDAAVMSRHADAVYNNMNSQRKSSALREITCPMQPTWSNQNGIVRNGRHGGEMVNTADLNIYNLDK